MERVPRKVIRPCPPQVDVERWEAGELVEVLDSFSWKAATVRQELCGNYYVVRLLGTPAEFTFHKANVRVRQSWQDERWVAIGKVIAFNLMPCSHFSKLTLVNVFFFCLVLI